MNKRKAVSPVITVSILLLIAISASLTYFQFMEDVGETLQEDEEIEDQFGSAGIVFENCWIEEDDGELKNYASLRNEGEMPIKTEDIEIYQGTPPQTLDIEFSEEVVESQETTSIELDTEIGERMRIQINGYTEYHYCNYEEDPFPFL